MEPFRLQIVDSDEFQRVARSFSNPDILINSIYWNEIDQYVFYYRTQTINLLSDRLTRTLEYFGDHVTTASIVRQILEIVFSACANQWVLTSAYNRLRRELRDGNLKRATTFGWNDLNEFVISLDCWGRRHLAMLGDLLNREDLSDVHATYFKTDYEPSTHRQIKITEWVANEWDEKESNGHTGLKDAVAEVERNYKYLCKFVHPNPQLFDPHPSLAFSRDEVVLSVKLCCMSIIENVLKLLRVMFLDDKVVKTRFQDLVDEVAYNRPGDAWCEFKENDLFPSVFNNFKDIVVSTPDGDVDVYKRGNTTELSRDAKRVAKQFDKLNDENKHQVQKIISDLRSRQ